MKKQILNIASLTFLVAIFISCQRDKLIVDSSAGDDNTAILPVSVDYSGLGISPQNTTVLFYNTSDGSLAMEHVFENNGSSVQSEIFIPIGEYDIVVFNELRDQVQNIAVEGYENISTLKFKAISATPIRTRSDQGYVSQPEMFGVRILRGILVDYSLVDYTQGRVPFDQASQSIKDIANTLMSLKVEPKISILEIVVHVKNVSYARMPALVDLRSIASEYFPHSEVNSMELSTTQFLLNNMVFNPGSTTDGRLSGSINIMGVVGDRSSVSDQPSSSPIELDFLFKMIDAAQTEVRRVHDITPHLVFDVSSLGMLRLTVEFSLADPLPVVTPEPGADSGFGSEVEDWGPAIEVPL